MATESGSGYVRRDPGDTEHGGAKAVVDAEKAHIKAWRGQEPRAGIALSGGGIRSATFGLGILQALAKGRWLPEFDYLSTVSGGGYTGASLSYLLNLSRTEPSGTVPKFDVSEECFPYRSYPMAGTKSSGDIQVDRKMGALLRRLRQNAKYLTPGNDITILSLLGVVLRNSFTSIVVHGSLIALVLLLLIGAGFLDSGPTTLPLQMNVMMWASAGLFGVYVLLSGLYVIVSGTFDTLLDDTVYKVRRGYEVAVHWLLLFGVVSFVVAVLPWLNDFLRQLQAIESALYSGAATSFFGVAASVWAFVQTSGVKKPKVPVGLAVAVASVLLLAGFVLVAFSLALILKDNFGVRLGFEMLVVVLIMAGWYPNVNYLSVHRYYRDRLMEVFMPDRDDINAPEACSRPTYTGNKAMLGNLCGVGAPVAKSDSSDSVRDLKKRGPYHLICTNVVLVASGDPRYRGRGGDSFVFSPLFTGSHATGWAPTNRDPSKGMTLATAMAVSGAAVNPATGVGGEGVTRQPVLSFLMSMLNIRLGYWLRNPGPIGGASSWLGTVFGRIVLKPNMIYPGLAEPFRTGLREDNRYLLLTDGGHFENLGLYELLRRRLKLIVVCDGAADPHYAFADLANALEKARADFGVLVEIAASDLDDLVPRPTQVAVAGDVVEVPMAKRGYLVAPIRYAPARRDTRTDEAEADCGLLIYITTTFFKDLDASLYGYRKDHPDFPDEPTSDQFFDEKQFESYRELGFQTAWRMMNDFSRSGSDPIVMLSGVELPNIPDATACTQVPPPFQKIRQDHRRSDEASRHG